MSEAQIWLVAGIILFILEIVTPGFVLANFGVAAVAAAIAAWLGADLTIQVMVFVIACLVSFVTVRPLLSRTMLKQSRATRTGFQAVIGRVARVTDAIPEPPDAGRIQVDGDSWRAFSVDKQPIEQGTTVRVVRVDSNTVYVERLS